MKKLILLASMLAMVMVAAAPAMAQSLINLELLEGGDANLAQEQAVSSTGGDSNAAAGNNFSAQSQEAANAAAVEANINQSQAAETKQAASSEALAKYGSKASSGDIGQVSANKFGDQNAAVVTAQSNEQAQANEQTSTENAAVADSSSAAVGAQEGVAQGGDGLNLDAIIDIALL